MSVDELARRLNVSQTYARRLLRKHVLRPVFIRNRCRYVLRVKGEVLIAKHRKRARLAMRELIRLSQEIGFYDQ